MLRVRPFTSEDLQRLAGLVQVDALAHHEERLRWQEQELALYLVAWRGVVLVGRATVLWQSKYPSVRSYVQGGCEVNALEAQPTGEGVGRALMEAAEGAARSRQFPVLGVAVGRSNVRAREFYDRLGYSDGGVGSVCDEWDEYDQDRALVRHHADACDYLVKSV